MRSRLVLPHSSASAFSITASLGIIYFVWASTYVGIAFMVEEIPPHTGSGFRFVTAGLLISLVILLTKGPKALFVNKRQIRNAMFIGFILIGLATPLIAVAAQYIGSGLIALLVAMTPVFVAILRFIFGDKPSVKTILGVLIGIVGVAVLVRPTADQSWYTLIPTQTWIAFIYISVMGAIAYSAYAFLLDNAPISLVATYAFVNPVVAVLLGAFLRSEIITATILFGGSIVVFGIALVVLGEKREKLVNPET